MAEPVAPGTLGSWRGEGVRLGQVLEALAELRRGEQRTATRASVTNLVLVARDDGEVARACAAVHRLGRRHPGRNIALLPLPDEAPPGIDAEVLLHGSGATGPPVWSEDVRLVVRGEPSHHLRSLIEPLTLAEIPVAVWFVSRLPDPAEPLLASASAVLVDSEALGDDGLAALARLARRPVLVDLCWIRLRPWRQLLGGLFELPGCRPFLGGVRSVEAWGPPSPRRLLAGWAATRLGVLPGAVHLRHEAEPGVRLVADHDGRSATFVVEQAEGAGGAVVRAAAELPDGERRHDRVSLPEDPLAWSLGEALTTPVRDRAHGQALQAALGFTA